MAGNKVKPEKLDDIEEDVDDNKPELDDNETEEVDDNDFYLLLNEVRGWRPVRDSHGRFDPPSYPIRIIVFGKSGCGKSSLINSLNWVCKFQGFKNPGKFENVVPSTPGIASRYAHGGHTLRLLKLQITENMEVVDTRGFQRIHDSMCHIMKIICKGYGKFNEDMDWDDIGFWKRLLYPLCFEFTGKMDFAVFVVSAINPNYYEECKALMKTITYGIGCAPLIVVTSKEKKSEEERAEMTGRLNGIGATRVVFVENYLGGMNRTTDYQVDIKKHTELQEVLRCIQVDYNHHLRGVYEHPKHRFGKLSILFVVILLLISWLSGGLSGIPRECSDLHILAKSGVYMIEPDAGDSFKAYCNMTVDGGGWTVIQKNSDASDVFNKSWGKYKVGFGEKEKDHWLGNEKIHRLTANEPHELRIDLESFNNGTRFALYGYFLVGSDGEASYYTLMLGKYSGTAGDSLHCYNGASFSTKDENLPQAIQKWWWKRECHHSNLNYGLPGIYWTHFQTEKLKSSEMKIRKKSKFYYHFLAKYVILYWEMMIMTITVTIMAIVLVRKTMQIMIQYI